MLRLLGFTLLACALSALGTAQTDKVGARVATKEDVLKFMEVIHLKAQLVQYFDGVAKQTKLGAEEGFKQKVPDATTEQLAEVDRFAENLFNDMPVDEMLDAMVPIYQKHLTKEDLDGILAFYSSPVGQKLQREQPAMTQEGMQVGGEIGRRRIGAMTQKMDEFVAKLAQQEQEKAAKPTVIAWISFFVSLRDL
jgi:hypothetical protein